MSRLYSIPFLTTATDAGTAIAGARDLFEILAASGKPFYLHEIVIGQTSDYGDAAAEAVAIAIKRATSGYTSGTGGTTQTPRPHYTNDAAAGATAEIANTTQALAGGGSLNTLRIETFNVQAGYQYLPTPEQRVLFLPGEACVVSITTPADAITVNGTAVIEEL